MTEQSQMLFIPKREILEMLKAAFDEGWQGYQDLRDPTAEQILDDWCEDYKERRLQETGMTPVTDVQMQPEVQTTSEVQTTFQFADGSRTNLDDVGDGISWGSVTINTSGPAGNHEGWTINSNPHGDSQQAAAH